MSEKMRFVILVRLLVIGIVFIFVVQNQVDSNFVDTL